MHVDDNTLILCGLAGYGIGKIVKSHRNRKEAKERAAHDKANPQPICGCTHHFAFHDPKTSACNAQERVLTKSAYYDRDLLRQIPGMYKERPCPCRRYTGPEPLTTFFAPDHAHDVGVEQL